MKHIKSKRIFESRDEEFLEDIKDICLELQDEGFTVNFYNDFATRLIIRKFDYQPPHLSNDAISFKYDEVTEVIERMKSFLGDKLKSVEVYLTELPRWSSSLWVNIQSQVFQEKFDATKDKIRSVEIVWDNTISGTDLPHFLFNI